MKRSSSVDNFQQIDQLHAKFNDFGHASKWKYINEREKKTDHLYELGVSENRIDRPDDEMKGKKSSKRMKSTIKS